MTFSGISASKCLPRVKQEGLAAGSWLLNSFSPPDNQADGPTGQARIQIRDLWKSRTQNLKIIITIKKMLVMIIIMIVELLF